jgi:hypothetical protein
MAHRAQTREAAMNGEQFLYIAGGMLVGAILVLAAGQLPWSWERKRLLRMRAEQAAHDKAHDEARIAAFKAKLDRQVEIYRAEIEEISRQARGGRAPHG